MGPSLDSAIRIATLYVLLVKALEPTSVPCTVGPKVLIVTQSRYTEQTRSSIPVPPIGTNTIPVPPIGTGFPPSHRNTVISVLT